MRKLSILILVLVFSLFVAGCALGGPAPTPSKEVKEIPAKVVNLTQLGIFDEPIEYQAPSPWYFVVQGTAEVEKYGAKDGVFYVTIKNVGDDFWHIQFGQHIVVKQGKNYKLSFDAKADTPRDIQVRFIQDQTWKIVVSKIFDLTTKMTTYTWEFAPSEKADIIVFDFGKVSDKSVPTTIYIDNVALEEN